MPSPKLSGEVTTLADGGYVYSNDLANLSLTRDAEAKQAKFRGEIAGGVALGACISSLAYTLKYDFEASDLVLFGAELTVAAKFTVDSLKASIRATSIGALLLPYELTAKPTDTKTLEELGL
jgi:hypothetical protein